MEQALHYPFYCALIAFVCFLVAFDWFVPRTGLQFLIELKPVLLL